MRGGIVICGEKGRNAGLLLFEEWYVTGKQREGEKMPAAAAGTNNCKG